MAKYKAAIKFRGIKEKKVFEENEEFEMTVKRAEEIEATVLEKNPDIKSVMTRLDEPETKTKKATEEPPTKE